MNRDIEQAHKRFSAAQKVEVSSEWIAWPEYETFLASLRGLERFFENGSLAFDVENERNWYWNLRRAVSSAPLHPREYVSKTPRPHQPLSLVGEVGEAFALLRKSCDELIATNNPLRVSLEQKLRSIAWKPTVKVQLLVHRREVEVIDVLLEPFRELGMRIEVLDSTRAKRSNIANAMFIFGMPESHVGRFKAGIERSREVAWIFNAPSAHRIFQLQLADCSPFTSSKYEVWEGAQQFVPKFLGSRPLIQIPEFEQHFHIDEVHAPSFSESDPVVEATLVHLLDGRYVYYSDTVPPSPICVRSGEANVEIDDEVRVRALQPGDVLLIRTGSASRSYLRQHAMTWLLAKYEQEEVDQFFGVIDAYKSALKTRYQSRAFIADAMRKGFKEHYVHNQILRAFHETTIATQRPENFITLAQLMGLDFGEKEWAAVSQVQTAHRQAGLAAVKELQENVINDESWLDIVSEPAIATLNSGSAGEIVLIPVVSSPNIKHQIAVTELGRLKINRRIQNGQQ